MNNKLYNQKYYLINKAKIIEKNLNYYINNKKEILKRQRLYNSLNKKKITERSRFYISKNKDKKKLYDKRYAELNPEKRMAKSLARKILINNICEICKSKNQLQRHHWRYDKPLLVNTLCIDCHNIQHMKGGIKYE
jgi:hypothetical protein